MGSRQLRVEVKRRMLLLSVMLVIWFFGTWNLAHAFPAWWDEGWTMTVARTWVERGHYGLLQFGEPAPPGLNAAFPVTAWIALGFKLFGVGIWQARFVAVIFTFLALLLLYRLTRYLYNRSVGMGALLVAVFMSVGETNPLHMGRQVLAEPFMFTYILVGYLGLYEYLRGKNWGMFVAILFWGIALETKAQVLPFWLCSILLPLVWALVSKRLKIATTFALATSAAWLTSQLLASLWVWILAGDTMHPPGVHGLLAVTAVVLHPTVRRKALTYVLVAGIPLICGMFYEAIRIFRLSRRSRGLERETYTHLAVWGFVASWLAWYIALSAAWGRYLWPAVFVGVPFITRFIYSITNKFNFTATLRSAASMFSRPYVNLKSVRSFVGICFVIVSVGFVIMGLYFAYSNYLDDDCSLGYAAEDVADYLNTRTPPHSLIETYDSELFVLLDRPYHFPPDQLHVDLLQARDKPQSVRQHGYNPLAFSPDYIVVRYVNSQWDVYSKIIEKGHYELKYINSAYKVHAAP